MKETKQEEPLNSTSVTEEMSKETKKQAEKTAAVIVQPAKKEENKCYIGPSIQGIVRYGTIFEAEGGLPVPVKHCIEEFPMMAKLFIEISGLPEAMKLLQKKSALRTISEKVAEKFN